MSRHLAAAQAKVPPARRTPSAVEIKLTKEQQAELDARIEADRNTPREGMSSRKFRRGRSPSATEARAEQITEEYLAEIEKK